MSLKPPKGTRDFYPDLMQIQNHIFSVWKDTCLAFGYQEYEAPVFEHLELYTRKSGEEIVNQLYHFKDKGGRDLALRPEITPTLARMVNQKGPSLKLPIRWFSMPRLFRYERSQRGRLREFFQLNMDIIGCGGVVAEVDLISAVIEMLKSFRLTEDDFYVGISSRKLLTDMLGRSGVAEQNLEHVFTALDKRDKVPEEVFRQMLSQIPLSEETIGSIDRFFACSDMEDLAAWQRETGSSSGAEELDELFSTLTEIGYAPYIKLDLSVVRGLAYYTGTVFEIFDRGKKLRAIAGGGRYDNLLEHLGGRSLTGVGFGIGDVVLYELLKEKGLLPRGTGGVDYFLVYFGAITPAFLSLARELRSRGRRVSYSLQPGKLKKQLALAEEQGAGRVIFFGSDKVKEGEYEVKDMGKREQTVVQFADL